MIQDGDNGLNGEGQDGPAESEDSEDRREDREDRAGADAESADSELPELQALREQATENREKYLRTVAELENVRKRAVRDVENARRYGLERLAQALLPVRDSLEAGLASGEQAAPEVLLDGKRATLRLLDAALEQVGIEELDPQGEPFDPAVHEAMATAPSDSAEPDTVLSVFQKGYSIHGRLLRPARVVVAQQPAASDDQPG